MRIQLLIATIAAFLLAGCDIDDALEASLPEDAKERVDRGREAILQRDMEGLRNVTSDAASEDEIAAVIELVDSVLPPGPPDDVQLAGVQVMRATSTSAGRTGTLSLAYTLDYADETYRLNMRFQKAGDSPWYFTWVDTAVAERHTGMSFDFATLNNQETVAIAGLFAIPGFVLLTFISSLLYRRVKRRILWSLFILAGAYPVFSFDWTKQVWAMTSPMITAGEGGALFDIFSFKLLGAGFQDYAPLEPAIIELAIPIGALLFWYRVMRGGPTRKEMIEQRL